MFRDKGLVKDSLVIQDGFCKWQWPCGGGQDLGIGGLGGEFSDCLDNGDRENSNHSYKQYYIVWKGW